MPHTRGAKNKISGSEILSDSDDDSYEIPPAAFSSAKKSPSNILTRSAKRHKNTPNLEQATATDTESFLNDPELEMVTYSAIKSHLSTISFVNSSTININSNGTFVPVSSHFSKPNFYQKPKKKSKTTTYTSSVADINRQSLQKKKKEVDKKYNMQLKLDKKYAWDATYERKAPHKHPYEMLAEKVKRDEESEDERLAVLDVARRNTPTTTTTTTTNTATSTNNVVAPPKTEFPTGSIVQICGNNLDPEKYENMEAPPSFFGCVKDFLHHDLSNKFVMGENETFVEFVTAGEYEWCHKSKQNTMMAICSNNNLTMILPPPSKCSDTNLEVEGALTKLFQEGKEGWEVQIFRFPCRTCGSPCCFFDKNKVVLRSLILKIQKRDGKSNKQKRYSAYKEGVQAVFPNMGEGARMRLGFCFVEMVRATFPDDEYKGFRYSDYHVDKNM